MGQALDTEPRTDIVNRFGYLAVGVNDLDEGCEFYSRFVRLEQTERVGDTAFMTGGSEHHWIRLEEGSGEDLKRIGYEVTDWIGDMAGFFRAGDRYHHSLVLIRAQQPSFNHFCIQVSSLDDVMRFRHNAARHGVEIRDDILRHAPSGSIGVYIKDAARGFAIEYCVGHPQVDDAVQTPRTLPLAPETVDVWRAPLPEIRMPAHAGAPAPSPVTAAVPLPAAAGSVPGLGREISALLETADRS